MMPAATPRVTLARPRHLDELCLQTRRLRAITRMATAAAGDLDRLLGAVCAEAPALFPGTDAVAVLSDDGDGLLRLRASIGFSAELARTAAVPAGEAEALATGRGDVVRADCATATVDRPALLADGLHAALWATIRCRGELGGALWLGSRALGSSFSESDSLFAEVLSAFLGGRLMELMLHRNIARLQRALWETARRAARPDIGSYTADITDGADTGLAPVLKADATPARIGVLGRRVV